MTVLEPETLSCPEQVTKWGWGWGDNEKGDLRFMEGRGHLPVSTLTCVADRSLVAESILV